MPYKVKGQCVYKKDTGKKVGCTKGDVDKYLAALHANVDESSQINKLDVVKMDIPFLIRVMEYSKEDAKTDMDLHVATEKMISLSKEGRTLTMNDYDSIFSTEKEKLDESKLLIKKLLREDLLTEETIDEINFGKMAKNAVIGGAMLGASIGGVKGEIKPKHHDTKHKIEVSKEVKGLTNDEYVVLGLIDVALTNKNADLKHDMGEFVQNIKRNTEISNVGKKLLNKKKGNKVEFSKHELNIIKALNATAKDMYQNKDDMNKLISIGKNIINMSYNSERVGV